MIRIKILFCVSICSYLSHAESLAINESKVITNYQLTCVGNASNKKNACNSSNCKSIKSRVLSLAKEINLAAQTGDEAKSLKLACLILDIFREQYILPALKYGGIDTKGDIVYIREFPIDCPIIEKRDNKGMLISYFVDEEKLKAMLSNNNACDYIVIFSPWDESILFKIKISDDFIFYLTAE